MSRFLPFLIPRLMLLSFLAVLACAAPSLADMTWNLVDFTLSDGGTVTGSFTYPGPYNPGVKTTLDSWSITVTVSPATQAAVGQQPYDPYSFSPGGSQGAWAYIGEDVSSMSQVNFWHEAVAGQGYPYSGLGLELGGLADLSAPGSFTVGGSWDVFGDYYYIMGLSGSGRLESQSEVPLPASVLLLATGLLGLLALRHRRAPMRAA